MRSQKKIFEAEDDAKKKINAMGVTYLTLACTKNTFRVIKNKKQQLKSLKY